MSDKDWVPEGGSPVSHFMKLLPPILVDIEKCISRHMAFPGSYGYRIAKRRRKAAGLNFQMKEDEK
jgi:hypothetical protein